MKFAFGIASLFICLAASATPALKWSNEQTLSVGYLGNHLAVDSSGAAFITGGTYSSATSGCMTATKHAPLDGAIAWKSEACDLYGFGYGVALDSAQNPVVVGYLGTRIRVVKLSSANGAPIWEQKMARESLAVGYTVSVLPNDDLIVVATSSSTAARHTRVMRLRGSDGSIMWESVVNNGNDDNFAAADVAQDGSVVVTTRSLVGANTYRWAVMKYRPDGVLAWTKILTTAQGQGTALKLDANGDVYAAGVLYVLNPAYADGYVYKFAAADGATIWQRNWSSANYNDYVQRMKLDGKGALYVTGGNEGQFLTAKLSAATGTSIWESRFSVAQFGDDAGLDMAFDAAGDLIVTGDSFYQSVQQARTIKYSAETGQRIWVRSDDSTRLGLGANVIVKDSAIYLISSLGTPGTKVRLLRLDTTVPQADANAHGLWWKSPAGIESGWGMNFAQQGNIIFMTWFTYDTDNSPAWFMVSNASRGEGNVYSGKLYRTTGPAFNSVPFNPSQVGVTEVGTATFEYDDDTNGVFHFTLANAPNTRYTHPVTRMVFATPVPTCSTSTAARVNNYQDLWWAAPAGVESGWGINLTHQQDIIFATWFTYGPDNKAMWLVASDVRKVPGQGEKFTGKVYKTKGSPYNMAFDATKFSIGEVGNMTLTFTGPNAGTFDYTVNGITQSKPITRMDFANPPTVCH